MRRGRTLFRHHWFLAVLCVTAIVLATYAGALNNELLGPLPHSADGPWVSTGVFRPLTAWTFELNRLLTGGQTFSYHATNLLLHVAVSLSILVLSAQILHDSVGPGPMSAALTFGVLPVAVDAVAWAPGRADVLSTLLAILSVLAHVRGRPAGRIAAVIAFSLALLSNETAWCVLPTIVAYDLLFRGRPARSWVGSYVALLFVLGGYLFARHVLATPPPTFPSGLAFLRALPSGLASYLPRIVIPHGLQAFEPYVPLSWGWSLAVLIGVLSVSSAVLAGLRRAGECARAAALGWCWFLFGLVPVAMAGPEVGDRFAYFPAVGLAIAVAGGLDAVFHRLHGLVRGQHVWPVVAASMGVVWSILGLVAAHRTLDWRTEQSLFESELRGQPNNPIAHRVMALIEQRAGRREAALAHVERAQALAPDSWATWDVACWVALESDRLKDAESWCTRSLELSETHPSTWISLARLHVHAERWADASAAADSALRLRPDHADALFLRALSAAKLGRTDEAQRDVRRVLEVDEQHEDALELLVSWGNSNRP